MRILISKLCVAWIGVNPFRWWLNWNARRCLVLSSGSVTKVLSLLLAASCASVILFMLMAGIWIKVNWLTWPTVTLWQILSHSCTHSWFCATFLKYFLMTCNYAPLVLSPPSSVASLFCDVNNSAEILILSNTADILMNPRHHDKLIIVFLFLVSQTQILWKLFWAYVRCIMLCRRDNVAEMRYRGQAGCGDSGWTWVDGHNFIISIKNYHYKEKKEAEWWPRY